MTHDMSTNASQKWPAMLWTHHQNPSYRRTEAQLPRFRQIHIASVKIFIIMFVIIYSGMILVLRIRRMLGYTTLRIVEKSGYIEENNKNKNVFVLIFFFFSFTTQGLKHRSAVSMFSRSYFPVIPTAFDIVPPPSRGRPSSRSRGTSAAIGRDGRVCWSAACWVDPRPARTPTCSL